MDLLYESFGSKRYHFAMESTRVALNMFVEPDALQAWQWIGWGLLLRTSIWANTQEALHEFKAALTDCLITSVSTPSQPAPRGYIVAC